MTLRRWRAVLLVIVVGLPTAGLIGSIASQVVPDGRIAGRLATEIDSGRLTRVDAPVTRLGDRVDGYGDCLVLGGGAGGDDRWNLVGRAIRSPSLGPCSRLVPRVREYERTGELEKYRDYFRYWHGYTVITRPVIAATDVRTMRIVAGGMLLAAAAALGRTLHRRHGGLASIAMLGPIVVTTDWWSLPWSLLSTLALTITLGTMAGVHAVVSRTDDVRAWVLAAAAAGALMVYVDLLTQAPGAWLGCVSVAVAADLPRHTRAMPSMRRAAFIAAAWIVGWSWMWVSKWILAAVVDGPSEVARDVASQMDRRLRGSNAEVVNSFGRATRDVLDIWFARPLTSAVTVASAALVVIAMARARRSVSRRALLVCVPAVIPFVWFEVLSSHTQIHDWIVVRAFSIAVGAVTLGSVLSLGATARADQAASLTGGARP